MSFLKSLVQGTSPKILAGRVSFLVAFVGAAIFYLFIDLAAPLDFFLSVGFFIVLFLTSYFLLSYSIESYVQEKLSVIYQTIHQLKKNPISSKDKENFENLITSIKHGSPYLYLPEENQKAKEAKKEMEHSGLLMTVALLVMMLIWLIRKYVIKNE